jgi:hypothetical protein
MLEAEVWDPLLIRVICLLGSSSSLSLSVQRLATSRLLLPAGYSLESILISTESHHSETDVDLLPWPIAAPVCSPVRFMSTDTSRSVQRFWFDV